MPFTPRKALLASGVALLTALTGCGDIRPVTVHPQPAKGVPVHTIDLGPTNHDTDIAAAAARTVWARAVDVQHVKDAAALLTIAHAQTVQRVQIGTAVRVHTLPGETPASFGPCGGDYPPCYRVGTESRGDYSAYNPGGCAGHGCYGKWQFSGAWAGKLGLPTNIATATPAQQDAAAKQLWNHGAGCGNWAAC